MWVPDVSWGRLGSEGRGLGSALHMLCPRHGGALSTRRPYNQQGYGTLYLYLYMDTASSCLSRSQLGYGVNGIPISRTAIVQQPPDNNYKSNIRGYLNTFNQPCQLMSIQWWFGQTAPQLYLLLPDIAKGFRAIAYLQTRDQSSPLLLSIKVLCTLQVTWEATWDCYWDAASSPYSNSSMCSSTTWSESVIVGRGSQQRMRQECICRHVYSNSSLPRGRSITFEHFQSDAFDVQ